LFFRSENPIDIAALLVTLCAHHKLHKYADISLRRQFMASAKPSLKILLVDDNKIACKSTAVLLEMYGHQVRTALSGRSALEIAKDYQPDAVILDIELPDMNGYDLFKQLKTLEKLGRTTFIALTGYEQEAVYPSDPQVNFHHFLQKPVDAAYLETLLLSQSSPK
jgi:CheY-like chemotaxis protein